MSFKNKPAARKWVRWTAPLLAAIVFFLGGCETRPDRSDSKRAKAWASVIDCTELTIEVPRKPARIVVVGIPVYTEMMVDLQATDRVIAVSDSPNNPPEVVHLPRVGDSMQPNLETIFSLKPDLVLGAFGEPRDVLLKAGIPVLLLGKKGSGMIDSLSEIDRSLETLSLVLEGDPGKGKFMVRKRKEAMEALAKRVPPGQGLRVACFYLFKDDTVYAEGKNSVANELIAKAGAHNVFSDISWRQISLEELLQRDPDVILTDPSQVPLLLGHSKLERVRAVKRNKVFGIKASQFVSSRVDKTFAHLLECLYPDVFKE